MNMSDIPKQSLHSIVEKYGVSICREPKRCEGLLRDTCGSYGKEIFVLVQSMREHIPADLLILGRDMPIETYMRKFSKRLEENLCLSPEASEWAVNAWAEVLGLINNQNIKKNCANIQPEKSSHDTEEGPNEIVNLNYMGTMIESLGSTSWEEGYNAAEYLIECGEKAVPFLIESISDENERVRWRIVFVLGEIGDLKAIGSVRELLNDPSTTVREEAKIALRKLL